LTQGADRPGWLSLELWGGDVTTHTIQITVNTNAVLGQWSWTGLTPTNLVVTIPSTALVAGSNELSVLVVTNNSALNSQCYVNSFTLDWPRTFTAVNGLIDFTANGNSVVSVSGFTSPGLTLLEVTHPKQPLLVTNVTVDQSYRLSFAPAGPAAHYAAWQTGAVPPVSGLALGQVAGFSSSTNGADYLIVSPPSLLTAATNLANYRRQKPGLKTLIAPLDEVYNEFGWGFPTPHAVQSLVAAAWTNWSVRPHYLVLLGRGTYDFLNIEQHNDNLTPPLMVSVITPPPYSDSGVFASDSLMGVVTTNSLPQVAVGRLPGLTTNDLNNLINKIINYESNAPALQPHALLIADAPDPEAGNFSNNLLQASAVLTSPFTNTVLLATNSSYPAFIHSQILTNWSQGVDLVNYEGHGAVSELGTGGYLASTDLTNNLLLSCPRWPVVAAMSCICGEYSVPGNDCLGEYLLAPTNGGAIAFFAPTGYSLNDEDTELNVRLCTLLQANAQLGLGDMIRQAMADHISQDYPSLPVWVYNLLGDPALQYRIVRSLAPLQITSITSTSLAWSGGWPPYQVEISTNLANPSAWQPLGTPLMNYNAPLTNTVPMGFLRISSNVAQYLNATN
jgi:hypothetical protein